MAAPEAGAPVWTTHAWSARGAWEQKDTSGVVSRVWPPEPEPEQQPPDGRGDDAYSGITLDLARSFSWSSDLGAPTPEEQELLHELGREFGLGDDAGELQSPSPSPGFASLKHFGSGGGSQSASLPPQSQQQLAQADGSLWMGTMSHLAYTTRILVALLQPGQARQ